MKSRMKLIVAALAVVIVNDRCLLVTAPLLMAAPVPAAATAPVAESDPTSTAAATPAGTVAPGAAALAPVSTPKTAPMVHVGVSGESEYIARAGDTLSQLAIALLGRNSAGNRGIIMAANPALQSNPDRVLEGTTYVAAAANEEMTVHAPAADVASPAEKSPAEKSPAQNSPAENALIPSAIMKYIARPGDTVALLAANLLGSDTAANRDAIIAQNPALQQDPHHLVAGQTYKIVAANGLLASTDAPARRIATGAPVAQPDADDVTRQGSSRTLRYTAKPGDTVTSLAIVLLGNDTLANRNLIIDSNPSLKVDPNHLVAGQTYWITAPTAAE